MKSKSQLEKESFTIYLPVPLATQLRIEAARSRKSMTEIVEMSLRQLLEQLREDRRAG